MYIPYIPFRNNFRKLITSTEEDRKICTLFPGDGYTECNRYNKY